MNTFIGTVMGAAVLLAATIVSAQAQRVTPVAAPNPPAAGTTQTLQAPYTATNPDQSAAGSRPLFHIGQLPVVVWAPVQPPYNAKANGTVAANWPWTGDAY